MQYQNNNGSSKYPTKEEILENLHQPTKQELLAIHKWKKAHFKAWAAKDNDTKISSLSILIELLSKASKIKAPTLFLSTKWAYMPKLHYITMDYTNPSIISALHEFGHALFGESELKACQYSIGIFSNQFPESYKKLEFVGHMLRKKVCED